MSNAKTFQEWAKGILPIVQAAANGELIEVMKSDGWEAKAEHLGFNTYDTYRIKPKNYTYWGVRCTRTLAGNAYTRN